MKENKKNEQEEYFDYTFDDTKVTLENLYVFYYGTRRKARLKWYTTNTRRDLYEKK